MCLIWAKSCPNWHISMSSTALSGGNRNRYINALNSRGHLLKHSADNTNHQAGNLAASGLDLICAQTICAIVGAVALQKGGEVANTVARTRVLSPMGIQ